jgi:membrane peptidoglycan carboxypeptidase
MTIRGKRLILLKLAGVPLIAFLTAFLAEFVWAYWRTPAIIARFETANPQPLTTDGLANTRVAWLLAVEDPNFYHHHGVDFHTPGAGYTTITQGVVKILFFGDFKPGLLRWRKVQQSVIALAFDARGSKQEQLSLFVGSVYLGTTNGRDVRGFSDASHDPRTQ